MDRRGESRKAKECKALNMESKDNYFFKGKKESVWPFVRKRVKKKIIIIYYF